MSKVDYRESGVDIDAGNETVRRIRGLARSTFTPGVLSDIGSFGGLFKLEPGRYRDPVLVASADGVGTKLKVAFLANRRTTVGFQPHQQRLLLAAGPVARLVRRDRRLLRDADAQGVELGDFHRGPTY